MKAKENVKDGINLQADALIDLPVTDEQADETKGGTTGGHIKVIDGTRDGNSPDRIDDIIVGAGPGGGPHIR